MRRTITAAVAATLIVFVWGAVSHMLIFCGAGYSHLRDEGPIVAALAHAGLEEGLYWFPDPDFRGDVSADGQRAFEARFRAGPIGMIVYHPRGRALVEPRQLAVQFACDALAAILVVLLACSLVGTLLRRATLLGAIGLFGALTVGSIYWNWYGFPDAFFAAQCVDAFVGWFIAALVVAKMVPPPRLAV